jgi:hypothetical protein
VLAVKVVPIEFTRGESTRDNRVTSGSQKSQASALGAATRTNRNSKQSKHEVAHVGPSAILYHLAIPATPHHHHHCCCFAVHQTSATAGDTASGLATSLLPSPPSASLISPL